MHWKGCTAEQSSQTVWINSFKIHGQETVNKTVWVQNRVMMKRCKDKSQILFMKYYRELSNNRGVNSTNCIRAVKVKAIKLHKSIIWILLMNK